MAIAEASTAGLEQLVEVWLLRGIPRGMRDEDVVRFLQSLGFSRPHFWHLICSYLCFLYLPLVAYRPIVLKTTRKASLRFLQHTQGMCQVSGRPIKRTEETQPER